MTALEWRRSGFKNAIKKRPGLFSQGRLGSPPPELPNHEMDSRELLIRCKRHFGNRIFPDRDAVLNRRDSLGDREDYGCLRQVWPASLVVQTSAFEVVTDKLRGSEN